MKIEMEMLLPIALRAGLHLPWRAVPGKPPAQYLKAPPGLTAESASADFHELRQGFSPHRTEAAFKRLMERLKKSV